MENGFSRVLATGLFEGSLGIYGTRTDGTFGVGEYKVTGAPAAVPEPSTLAMLAAWRGAGRRGRDGTPA